MATKELERPPWDLLLPVIGRPSIHRQEIEAALGRVLCQNFPEFRCVTTRCPVRDSTPHHPVAICRWDDCEGVVISCSYHHSQERVLAAILKSLDPRPKLMVIPGGKR